MICWNHLFPKSVFRISCYQVSTRMGQSDADSKVSALDIDFVHLLMKATVLPIPKSPNPISAISPLWCFLGRGLFEGRVQPLPNDGSVE